MRFIKTRPSGIDKDIIVYEFVFNKAELTVLRDLVFLTRNNTPNMTETSQFRNRLQNIYKEFDKVLKGFYENKK